MNKAVLLLSIIMLGTVAVSAQAAITSYLVVGSRGPQVLELQSTLTQRGFYHGPITGYFGRLTRNAVISFQAANSIAPVGVVGPLTRRALNGNYQNNAALYSLSPSSGSVGTYVTVNGTGFTQTSAVHFDARVITPTFISSSTLAFTVPPTISPYCPPGALCPMYLRQVTPGDYSVSVSDGGNASNALTFTVTSNSLSIASITPVAGPIGTSVTIKGSGFTQNSYVNFGNGFISNPAFIEGNTLAFTVPSTITGGCKPPMMCPNYIVQVTPGIYNVSVYQLNGQNSATSNVVQFTVTAGGSHTPAINGVSGPTVLAANQTGTWTIRATDPDNSQLTYSVLWGDEAMYGAQTNQPSGNAFAQQTTFTHAYAYSGNYTVRFYVRNSSGNTAASTISVIVTQ